MKFWSKNAKGITKGWLKGLQDRCISRNLKWGVPIPKNYLPDKVFYVWFEAPIGYISMTRRLLFDKYDAWWKTNNETKV